MGISPWGEQVWGNQWQDLEEPNKPNVTSQHAECRRFTRAIDYRPQHNASKTINILPKSKKKGR
jgi:hypothetical protein